MTKDLKPFFYVLSVQDQNGMALMHGALMATNEAEALGVALTQFQPPNTILNMRGVYEMPEHFLKDMGVPDKAAAPKLLEKGTFEVVDEIYAERRRQVEEEGYESTVDDKYGTTQLPAAAAAYCLMASGCQIDECFAVWPWMPHLFKPKTRRKDLVCAAALIVAEIERLDRLAKNSENTGT